MKKWQFLIFLVSSAAVTGVVSDECGFIYNDQIETNRIFTQPGVEVELSSLSVQAPCQLRVLAVGGGGNGALGGGGSGYVQYFTQTLTSTPSKIKLTVGDKGEASNVTIDGTMISALPGGNGGDGGNGHSGGGGGPDDMCYGGSNGSDGECSNGGKGTGEDLATFNFKNFDISPGDGGKYFIYSTGFYFGGGGGGVLIDNDGPGVKDSKDSVRWSSGQGYGAGATYHVDNTNFHGNPGVIVVEVVEE